MANLLIVGASRGLGLALAQQLPKDGDHSWLLSRSPPESGAGADWIAADLRDPRAAAAATKAAIGEAPLHCVIYNAGVWEEDVLSRTSLDFLLDVINVNLAGALALVKVLEPNIRAGRGNLIMIGSTCGLENEGSDIPGYVSSKFGLRGLTHALRERFRKSMVRVTCISPGSMASSLADPEDGKRIPLSDMVRLIQCLIDLSPAACPKEIVLPATLDEDV